MPGEKLNVSTIEEARALVRERNPAHVKVGVFDVDGVLRGKYIARDKFLSALDDGFGFCNALLGWDVSDTLYDNSVFTGWHSGYPDVTLRILPKSAMVLPFENETLFFASEFAGTAEAICPRAFCAACWRGQKAWAFRSVRRWSSSSLCSKRPQTR